MMIKGYLKLFIICCCFLVLVRGGCNSYGHSCWGAHGKRSDSSVRPSSKDGRVTLLQIILDKMGTNDELRYAANTQSSEEDQSGQLPLKRSQNADLIFPISGSMRGAKRTGQPVRRIPIGLSKNYNLDNEIAEALEDSYNTDSQPSKY